VKQEHSTASQRREGLIMDLPAAAPPAAARHGATPVSGPDLQNPLGYRPGPCARHGVHRAPKVAPTFG
jgi:hypothetical protein